MRVTLPKRNLSPKKDGSLSDVMARVLKSSASRMQRRFCSWQARVTTSMTSSREESRLVERAGILTRAWNFIGFAVHANTLQPVPCAALVCWIIVRSVVTSRRTLKKHSRRRRSAGSTWSRIHVTKDFHCRWSGSVMLLNYVTPQLDASHWLWA